MRGQREAPWERLYMSGRGKEEGNEGKMRRGEREREQRPPRRLKEMRNNKRKRQRERSRTGRKEIKRNGGKGSESAHTNDYVLPMHTQRVRGPVLGSLDGIPNLLVYLAVNSTL